ncbi:putative membrane protein [Amorphus suaedae]
MATRSTSFGRTTMIHGDLGANGHRPKAATHQGKPTVRRITLGDVRDAFGAGMADWREHPLAGMGFGLVYAAAGAVILAVLLANDRDYLIVPALSAFLLLGPGVALGLYEISRRLETGEEITLPAVVGAGLRHGGSQIAIFGCVLLILSVVWIASADFLHDEMFGHPGWSLGEIISLVLTTAEGARYAIMGTAVGALFAGATFLIGVVGAPMLLDRDVDVLTACTTSARAVMKSPGAFLVYGALVTVVVAAGMAAFLVGLLVALPVIGFTTWHLYRRAVD